MISCNRYARLTPLLFLSLAGQSLFSSDTVLLNGHIYTANKPSQWAEALAITGDKIDAVGSNADITRHRSANTKVIDLAGKTVIPGITDGHVHLWFGALALHGFNLSTAEFNITSKAPDLWSARSRIMPRNTPRIQLSSAESNSSPITQSRQLLQEANCTHEILDRAVPDRPLVIHEISEHALWVNQKTLDLAHISDPPWPDPVLEANILRDPHGHPTGVLMESAAEIVERSLPDPPEQSNSNGFRRPAVSEQFRHHQRDHGDGEPGGYRTLRPMRDRGLLTLRTRTAFGAVAVNHHLTPQFLAALEKARTDYHDSWVSANLVKFFADGLADPPLYTPEEFKKIVVELDKRGYQMMSHSIGFDSARMVSGCLPGGGADQWAAGSALPHGARGLLECGRCLALLETFGYRERAAEFLLHAGRTKGKKIDVWNSLLKTGATLAFSSDWPGTWPPSPFAGMQEALTREITREVTPQGPVGEVKYGKQDERITIEQAVLAYTRTLPMPISRRNRTGTLEPGKLADLAVLSRDIFTARPEDVGKTRVTMTMVGGKIVFGQ